jgi:Tfp pilus assembly protein PilX
VSHPSRQRGATLVVSLILLIVLTMLVMATLAASNTNLRVVGNMQAQRQLEAVAQKAIEDRITNLSFFKDAIDDTGVWAAGKASITFTDHGYAVTIFRPLCTYTVPEEGTSALNPLVPESTAWAVRATASDDLAAAGTQGKVEVTQGVRMRMLANNCPP